jgi:hypothetical protein
MADYNINAITRRVVYTGSAGLGPYAFSFEIIDQADVGVYFNQTALTLSSDYTVTINANGTGSVTIITGGNVPSTPTANDTVIIIGARNIERTTDFVTAGDLLASSLNEQLDSNIIFEQQIDERVDRSIKFPVYDSFTGDNILPAATARADKILKFDTDGNVGVETASALFAGAVVGANFVNNTFTGDGSQTAFTTTVEAGSKNNAQVYIDGVYQLKSSFSVSGLTLTFNQAPSLNSQIEVVIGNAIDTLDADSGNINYNQGDTGAQTRTVESKLQELVSVKDFGAIGNGSTSDYTAFVNAMAAGKTLYVPAGTYAIGTALTLTGHFVFDEGAKIKANAALVFNMSIEAGQYQIGEHGTGSIEWSIPHEICVEWLGVLTSNTASVNKTNYENFLKHSNPTTYPYVVKFGRGSYPYAAPFYITSRIAVEGQTMFASELTMSGSDEHAVESCEIDSNAIVTDGTMDASTVYSHFRNMEVNCSSMTFTGNVKKFMFYGVGVSSSIIEGNRFGCDGSFQNNMDGIFLGPTYFSEVTDSTKNRASNRNTVRNNRITNFRDGIVLGRHSQSKTDREPAGGGIGDFVGGACFENTIGPRNILRGSGTEAARPRFGIVAHYYNIDSSTAPNARPKPYAVNVYGNTVLEFDSGTSNLTGTIAVSSGSATVTGTGTSFTSELPNDLSSGVARRLAIGFTHSGTSYMFEVDSIDSDTQITLKSSDLPNITQSGLTVDTVRSGVALFTGSEGQNMVFRDHYLDHWCFPVQLTSNAKGASFYDNHSAGSPLLHLEDNSDADSNVTIRIHTPGFESRTNGVKDSSQALNRSYFKGRTIVYGSEFEEGPELTISSGQITATQNYHQVDTESDAATDDLDTINGGTVGQILILRPQNDARTVVLKDGTGNLRLSGDFSLDDLDDTITLIYTGSNWLELATANNA